MFLSDNGEPGKSYTVHHRIQQLLAEGHGWDEILYLNFEDERLENFTSEDFNRLLECHQEMYGKRPMLFLDEIQNIEGWHKFARRMADSNYTILITGSNANMLSGEINTTLGGRFLTSEIYPYSFKEYLDAHRIPWDENDIISTEGRAKVVRCFDAVLALRWSASVSHDAGKTRLSQQCLPEDLHGGHHRAEQYHQCGRDPDPCQENGGKRVPAYFL